MFEPSPYQDRRTWRMTPAMIRARKPFFRNNMIGISILLGLSTGIYFYTYRFLHKDNDFVDVPIPPIDEKELKKLREEYYSREDKK